MDTLNSLFDYTSNAPLILFRWLFGAALTVFSISRCQANTRAFSSGKIYIGYELTRFLRPLPPIPMRVVLWMDFPLSVAFMTGIMYPLPAFLLCILHSYVLLLDSSRYLNHNYLVCLLLGLYCVVDAGSLRLVPYWQLFVIQFQFLIVYFYAGLGKLNRDWLIRNEPFRHHLSTFKAVCGPSWFRRRVVPSVAVGKWIEQIAKRRITAKTLCWSGAIFDLGIGFGLMSPTLLPIALVPFVAFHVFNQWFYGLGIFPFINYASIILFLNPEIIGLPPPLEISGSNFVEPHLFLVCWIAVQFFVPLRRYVHTYLIPKGTISIHSDHHRHFSWTMKLRETTVVGFSLELFDRRTGRRIGTLALGKYLAPSSIYQCARSPRAIVMALERIEPQLTQDLGQEVGIRSRGRISYNDRPFVTPIDPKADLRGQKVRIFSNYPWQFLGD